ncbi:hypothetical protein [Bradyrhizobium valentinum]|uniref:Uncharacterized protein n=1 Tax=Bradyrhizobium valentinum TaxID=1518501 RepID=A0A0R3LLZ5_9BRAD|nr:hypothetical protein [Bradyrhizobium valentinum]KRQ93328.1 hypothetical protein CP49_19230 [Bradyrhizobium valentinum]KRR08775.1 hypothetical protein CQ10_14195 [Bradyrhizobium valentinum]
MLIARRADTRARADFATWLMMAKLNGFSALPAEAQTFLEGYRQLLARMTEADASEATIQLMYKSYYAEMGGSGTPPEIPSRASEPVADTGKVTAFRRPPARPKPVAARSTEKPRLPVALIFICLAIVYVSIRYFWR